MNNDLTDLDVSSLVQFIPKKELCLWTIYEINKVIPSISTTLIQKILFLIKTELRKINSNTKFDIKYSFNDYTLNQGRYDNRLEKDIEAYLMMGAIVTDVSNTSQFKFKISQTGKLFVEDYAEKILISLMTYGKNNTDENNFLKIQNLLKNLQKLSEQEIIRKSIESE